MVSLVERMLASCTNSSPKAATPHEKTALASDLIEATDGQIDGGPALWADGRGDRDCGDGEQVEAFGESL